MSERGNVTGLGNSAGVTISFGERYLGSDHFQAIYREGMRLVEETAHYLDGDGRRDSKSLKGQSALSFATESMRLTTRLMNLASWLLIRRSVNTGEMTLDRARTERLRLKLDTIGRPSHVKAYAELPERLRVLIEKSFEFQDKIVKLDRLFGGGPVLANPPTSERLPAPAADADRIRLVFDRDRGDIPA
jgi:regulator of CtrA degradation